HRSPTTDEMNQWLATVQQQNLLYRELVQRLRQGSGPSLPMPWRIQLLLYDAVEAQLPGQNTRFSSSMSSERRSLVISQAQLFVYTDLPALSSGSIAPSLSVKEVPVLGALSDSCGDWPGP